MAYISTNYKTNPAAPVGMWTCAPSSSIAPSATVPEKSTTKGNDLCGQCVSYVKTVCPSLPSTSAWKKGKAVKGQTLVAGTVIATFNATDRYQGHAAIFDYQDDIGIHVYDQFVTLPSPQPVSSRVLRWGGSGVSNNGDDFYVVE